VAYATATSTIELWKWKMGFSVFSALSAAWVHIDVKGATLWTEADYALCGNMITFQFQQGLIWNTYLTMALEEKTSVCMCSMFKLLLKS